MFIVYNLGIGRIQKVGYKRPVCLMGLALWGCWVVKDLTSELCSHPWRGGSNNQLSSEQPQALCTCSAAAI